MRKTKSMPINIEKNMNEHTPTHKRTKKMSEITANKIASEKIVKKKTKKKKKLKHTRT